MLPQRREALDWWNAELDRILSPDIPLDRLPDGE
jgi:hypothetical protein